MCVITCCGGKGCCGCCSMLTCCFPIRGCTYAFVFLSFLLQLAMCIFFLVYEAWYSFIAVAFVVVFHIYFIFVSRGQRFCLLHLFTTYSSLWSLIYILLFIWSIVLEIWPDSWSPFREYYLHVYGYDDYYDYGAYNYVTQVGWLLMASSLVCAIVQSYTSRLLFGYKKWLELQAVRNRLRRHQSSHAAPHVTVINTPVYTIQPPPTVTYQPPPMSPPPPPPPPNVMQPGSAMLPPPQSAHVLPTAPPVSPVPTPDNGRRPMYPEVPPMPSSSSHLEAPPPYAAAVGEAAAKGAYENYGYEQKY